MKEYILKDKRYKGKYGRLTDKQKRFADLIISGYNNTDAFRECFDCSKYLDTSVNSKACVYRNMKHINGYIERIQKKAMDKVVKKLEYTALDSFNKLNELQGMAIENSGKRELNNAIKAEELKGKLAGIYVDKSDVTSGGQSIVRENIAGRIAKLTGGGKNSTGV